MTFSIVSVVSLSRDEVTLRRNLTQLRTCRTHSHGSAQSSRITSSVSGIVRGFNRGLSKGANDGEGSEMRYSDKRARISMSSSVPCPEAIKVSHFLYLHGLRQAHRDMYILGQIDLLLEASFCASLEAALGHLLLGLQGILSGSLGSPL